MDTNLRIYFTMDTGLNSKVWGNNLSNYAARDWMREDLSAQERLLSTFPSINPYTAQMILYGEELSLKEFFALAKVTTRDNGQNTQKDVDASAATKKLWYLPSKCIQDALTLAWADFGSGVNLEATIDVGYETVTQMRPDLSSEPTTAPAITTLLRAVEGSAAGSKHGNAVHVRETHYNNHTALGTDLATDANNDHKLHAKMEAIDRAYQKCNAGGNDDNAHNDSSRTSIVEIQDPCPDVSYQNQYQQQKQQQRDRQNELQNQGEQNPQYASSYGTNSIVNSYPVHSHSYQQEIESHPHKQAHDHDQNYHDTHHRHHGHESSPLLSSRSWSHSQPIPLSTSPSEMCIGQDDDYLASVAKYQQILQSPQFSTDQGADVHVAEHSQYQFKNQSQNSFQRRQHEYHRELLQELRETHCQEEYNPPQQWQQHSKSQFTPQHRESSYDQPHGVHQLHRKQYQRHQQRDHLSNACDDSSDIRNTFNQNIPEHTRSYYSNRPQYTDADNGTISNEGNINKHYDSSAEARISREHQLRGDHTRYHRSHGISSPSESDCHNRHHRQSFESLIPSSSALSQTMTDRLDTYTYATNSNDPHHDHRSSRMHGHSHNHSHHRHQNHAKKTDVNVSFHTPVSHRNARFVSESSDNDINALKQRSLGLRKQNGYGQKTGQTRLVWRQ